VALDELIKMITYAIKQISAFEATAVIMSGAAIGICCDKLSQKVDTILSQPQAVYASVEKKVPSKQLFLEEIAAANASLSNAANPPPKNTYVIPTVIAVDESVIRFYGKEWRSRIQAAIDYASLQFTRIVSDDNLPENTDDKPLTERGTRFHVIDIRYFSSADLDYAKILQEMRTSFHGNPNVMFMYFTAKNIEGKDSYGNHTNSIVGAAHMPGNHMVIECNGNDDLGMIIVHEAGHAGGAPHSTIPRSFMFRTLGGDRFDDSTLSIIRNFLDRTYARNQGQEQKEFCNTFIFSADPRQRFITYMLYPIDISQGRGSFWAKSTSRQNHTHNLGR